MMKPTAEERIIAIISHLSALALGSGLVIPAVFWSENRRNPAGERGKSAYLRFQTLQALGYQSLGYTVWMLLYLLVIVLLMVAMFVTAALVPNASQNKTIPMVFSVVLLVSAFGLLGIYLLLPVIAAVFCGLGKDFRYPILGGRLARSLGYAQPEPEGDLLDADFEERFAAAMGHFAVIQPMWGMLAPAWLWLNHQKHSASLKFQSAQTTLYQIIVNLLLFGLTFLSIALGVISIPISAIYLNSGEWAAVAGMMVMICLLSFTGLIIPLFHILGQWAGLQVLRGYDFRYPLLGGWVAKWIDTRKS
jgi:uncharacterized Tic20 family protein